MNLPDFLAENPDGFVHFAGHRIGLIHVVDCYNEGYSPEMLCGQFPTLPLALIHKSIAFYLENRGEIDAYVASERKAITDQAQAPRQGPDLVELRRRVAMTAKVESP